MKTNQIKLTLTVLTLVASTSFALSQGFVNLDFEDATIAPTPPGGATFPADPAQCFPGWTVGGAGTVVMYNDESIGAPAISPMGPDFPNVGGFNPLQGSYSVFLQYFDIHGGPPTLSQTGMIPSNAHSISFLVGSGLSDGTLTLNGVNIPLVSVAGGRMVGDISAFKGDLTQMTFSTTTGNGGLGDYLYFDDIQFSSSLVPEPSEFAFSAIGACLLAFRRWRKFPR